MLGEVIPYHPLGPSNLNHPRIGWDSILVFLPYSQRFRKHRQLLHSHFGPHTGPKFQPIQLQNALILAQGLMENTKDYQHLLGRYWSPLNLDSLELTSCARYTTAIVMRIAYGHQIISDDDEFVRIAHDSGYTLNNSGPPGGTAVDLFPICAS